MNTQSLSPRESLLIDRGLDLQMKALERRVTDAQRNGSTPQRVDALCEYLSDQYLELDLLREKIRRAQAVTREETRSCRRVLSCKPVIVRHRSAS